MKKWVLLRKSPVTKSTDIVKILLKNRGITGKKKRREFLNPSLNLLTIKNAGLKHRELKKAILRVRSAVRKKESIVVYCDYDADGIASGAIVWETLYSLGAKVMPYVPHRLEEGYGLSCKGIDKVKEQFHPSLIITVDHGISSVEEIDYARQSGIEVIIIDHHVKPDKLPNAYAIVHTTGLAASGIAWMFSSQLINDKEKSYSCLDLAALGTIADLVPLVGPNRNLVYSGLKKLNETKRIGLLSLIKNSGLPLGKIGTYEVGHILAPRINATGRLTHALDALRLICTRDQGKADDLARQISSTNRDRQYLTQELTNHASLEVKNIDELSKIRTKRLDKILIVTHENYQQGVIGLIAGKLVDEYYRPAIVISRGVEYSKASARSVAGFNILEAIRSATDILVNVGGHPMAAGFTIRTKHLKIFQDRLTDFVNENLSDDLLTRVLKIDANIPLSNITDKFYIELKKLAPFGVGNPEPVFASSNVEVAGAGLVGKEKNHLKMVVRDPADTYRSFNAIGFNMPDIYAKLGPGVRVNIAYTVSEDTWNTERNGLSRPSLQLKLKDVKFLF